MLLPLSEGVPEIQRSLVQRNSRSPTASIGTLNDSTRWKLGSTVAGSLCVRGRSTNEILGTRHLVYPKFALIAATNTWHRVGWDEVLYKS